MLKNLAGNHQTPSQSVSTQQVLPVASSSPTSSSKQTSTKPSLPDVSAMREVIDGLFPAGEVVHSFYHCTETKCSYQKEKGKKKFNHAWLFRSDLSYNATTGCGGCFSSRNRACIVCSADSTMPRASITRVHHMEWNPPYVSRPRHL